jgi:hypothetical protein
MKRKFELTEKDIKEAIIVYVLNTTGAETNEKNVLLTAESRRDQFDREAYGHVVTATVTEADSNG